MSYKGTNPNSQWLNFEPQSSDPANPNEGDVFYSDGTPRLEGLWVYINGTWAQISTSVAASVFNNITFTPQAATPSPSLGMVFNSDGTSMTAGLWLYTSSGWTQLTGVRYQEFTLKDPVTVRVATITAGTLASSFENGDTIDATVLATNDVILIKNQATASENGVYIVQATGAPIRHSSADTYQELNDGYCVVINPTTPSGAALTGTNISKIFYQTSVLTSLSSSQIWSETPANYSFTVPADTYEIEIFGVGAGGGGGAGGSRNSGGGAGGGAGGGGGGGGQYSYHNIKTTPGETLTLTIGKHGQGGKSGTDNSNNASSGSSGGNSLLINGSGTVFSIRGGGYGGHGGGGFGAIDGVSGEDTEVSSGGAGGDTIANPSTGGGGGGGGAQPSLNGGGDGGSSQVGYAGSAGGFTSGGGGGGAIRDIASGGTGGAGGVSDFVQTGAAGGAVSSDSGGGGGGGASYGAGGAGGANSSGNGLNGTLGGGGGGAAGSTNIPTYGGQGGVGGAGYLRLSW